MKRDNFSVEEATCEWLLQATLLGQHNAEDGYQFTASNLAVKEEIVEDGEISQM